jgi:hypothetical protein
MVTGLRDICSIFTFDLFSRAVLTARRKSAHGGMLQLTPLMAEADHSESSSLERRGLRQVAALPCAD